MPLRGLAVAENCRTRSPDVPEFGDMVIHPGLLLITQSTLALRVIWLVEPAASKLRLVSRCFELLAVLVERDGQACRFGLSFGIDVHVAYSRAAGVVGG